jgi:hypothetical protein
MRAENRFTLYRDLPAALTRHSWLALCYALVLVLVIYGLGRWLSASLLFLFFQLPTLAAAIYVTSGDPYLRFRLPLLWILTAVITWSYSTAKSLRGVAWPVEILSAGIVLLVAYWLINAVRKSKAEFREKKEGANSTSAFAWLFSAWGATLQIVFLALLPLKHFLQAMLSRSIVGVYLIQALEMIRLTSPMMWLPSGLLVMGLIFFAVLRFADYPYHAVDYKTVLPSKLPPGLNEVLAAIRVPVWLVVVIIGFLIHFVMLLRQVLIDFGDEWLGRFLLVLSALAFPVAILVFGHTSFFWATEQIHANLSGSAGSFWLSLLLLLTIHLLVLLGLFLYVVASAPLGMNVFPISTSWVGFYIKGYLRNEGFPAAQAIGKAFALYGIVFLAIPLATLLPGGSSWGIFSSTYTLMIIGVSVGYVLKEKLTRIWHKGKPEVTDADAERQRKAS